MIIEVVSSFSGEFSMLPSTPQEALQRNADRVIRLMQRSIDKFNQTNNPQLANQWKKILLNYKRAFTLKIQNKI